MEFSFLTSVDSSVLSDTVINIQTSIGKLRISILDDDLVRVRFTGKKDFETDFSYAVIKNEWFTQFKIQDITDKYICQTNKLIIEVDKNLGKIVFKDLDGNIISQDEKFSGISVYGNEIVTYKELDNSEKFFGLGEKTGNLDRRGHSYKMWNTDFPDYGLRQDPLYVSIPFFIGMRNHKAYGYFLDNTYETNFDMGASQEKYYSFGVKGGELNYYFFYGPDVQKVVEKYTELTGKPNMPPIWALGYQQCRWSYFPDTQVESIVQSFRNKKIPLDVIYLDIEWMDAYKVFKWDENAFSNPLKLSKKLNDLGVKMVTIIDPGVKADENYFVAKSGLAGDHFVKYPDGELYKGEVWAGESYFPDFTKPETRYWWSEFFNDMIKAGIKGFWNDMNEPAVWGQTFPEITQFDYDGSKKSHKAVHNVYGMQMARASFDGSKKYLNGERPFIITRSAYAGVQRYSSVWTGDNGSTEDDYLQGAVMVQGLNLSGVSFCGPDIGGFAGEPTKELFERWLQLGVFTPFFRTHSMKNTKSQEPWSFGEDVESNAREMIKLRYKLLPYIYTAFYQAHKYAIPIVKPLFWYNQNDEYTYNVGNQMEYYFGDSLLIAVPKIHQDYTRVYLPEGNWYEFDTKKIYPGKQDVVISSGRAKLPVFIKEGSVIPMREAQDYTTQNDFTELELHVYPGKNNTSYFYEDDGISFNYENNDYLLREINLANSPDTIDLDIKHHEGKFKSKIKDITLFVYNVSAVKSLVVNKKEIKDYEIISQTLIFKIKEKDILNINLSY